MSRHRFAMLARVVRELLVAVALAIVFINCGSSSPQPPNNPCVQPSLSSVTLASSTVQAGSSITGTVTLSVSGGSSCAVSVPLSGNAAVATINPSTLSFGAGVLSATFTVTGVAGGSVNIVASFSGATSQAALTVTGTTTTATVASVVLSANTISGVGTVQGTVNLTAAASTGGVTVNLSSSNTNAATVQSTVVVAQGATSAQFTVTSLSVGGATNLNITATIGGSSQSAGLTVNPPAGVVTTFVVMPNAGTTASGEQCEVAQETVNGNLMNRMKCTFDARGSSAPGGINSYTFTFQLVAGGTQKFTTNLLQNPTLPCGNFPGTGATVDRPVTLDLVTPNGPGHLDRQITFRRNGPC